MLNHTSPLALHIAHNVSLIILSIVFLPISLAVLFASYSLRLIPSNSQNGRRKALPSHERKTVFVTGISNYKGLGIARTFYLSGHRVIGAVFEPDNVPIVGRCSCALSACYLIQKPDRDSKGISSYISNFLYLVEGEKIDLWVNCSSAAVAIEDSLAAEKIEEATKCRVIQFNSKITKSLEEKYAFIEKTMSLEFAVPETYHITSSNALTDILEKVRDKKYLLTSISEDNPAREDNGQHSTSRLSKSQTEGPGLYSDISPEISTVLPP
jgi:hypothetical protein